MVAYETIDKLNWKKIPLSEHGLVPTWNRVTYNKQKFQISSIGYNVEILMIPFSAIKF